MGAVFLGQDETGVQVAIKTVRKDVLKSSDMIERFQRENRIALKLNHDRIVKTYSVGQTPDGVFFMICEYCSNGDIMNYIRRNRLPGIETGARWLKDTLEALSEADRHKIIHRDIKPQNLLIDSEIRVKLGDFGLARGTSADATRLTIEGMVTGSPHYISPEQIKAKEELDIRVDIYSAGASFYHILTGAPLFNGKNTAAVLVQHVKEKPQDIAERRSDIPEPLAKLIHSMVAKDRNNRPINPDACLALLDGIAADCGWDLDSPIISNPSKKTEDKYFCGTTVPNEDEHRNSNYDHSPSRRATVPIEPDPASAIIRNMETIALPSAARTLNWRAVARIESPDSKQYHTVIYSQERVVFGRLRDETVDLCLRLSPLKIYQQQTMDISSRHGELIWDADGWWIADCGSKNGVFYNGVRLEPNQAQPISSESTIGIAGVLTLVARQSAGKGLILRRINNLPDWSYYLTREPIEFGSGGLDPTVGKMPLIGTLSASENGFHFIAANSGTLGSTSFRADQEIDIAYDSTIQVSGWRLTISEFNYEIFR